MSDDVIPEEGESPPPSVPVAPLPYSWLHITLGAFTCAALAIISLLLIAQFTASRPHDLRPVTQNAREAVSGFLITHRVPQSSVTTSDLALEKTRQAHYYTFDMDVSVPRELNGDELKSLLEQYLRTQHITPAVNDAGLDLRYGNTQFAQIRFTKNYRIQSPTADAAKAIAPSKAPQAPPADSLPTVTLPTLPDIQTVDTSSGLSEKRDADSEAAHTKKPEGWTPPSLKTDSSAETHEGTATKDAPVAKETPAAKEVGRMAMNSLPPVSAAPVPFKAKLAIIVDDGGYGGEPTDIILSLSNALTLSILPNTPQGTAIAQKASRLGFEIMLHMPMENLSADLRHPGQLNVDMTETEIRQLTRNALDQVPQAVGVNNHTGSKFTTDPHAMALFLDTVKKESLYFVDSRTTESSRALDMALAYGIPSEKRDLFLDHKNDIDMIRMRFEQIEDLALKRGHAIAICHFRPNTATVLSELLPELEKRGIQLVHASELVQ